MDINTYMKIDEAYPEAYRLAKRFHELYEISAPAFGYKTKDETKEFDPESSNGRLMAWVCFQVVQEELEKRGVANLEKELDLSKSYDLVLKNAECRKAEDIPNDDNTINRQFTLTISELSAVQIIGEITTYAKKKGSQSKELRWEICKLADKLGVEREGYYSKKMSELIKQVIEEIDEQ
jgi:hypothetical protein